MVLPPSTGWFSIDSIDLSGIARASITLGWQKTPVADYTFEIRVDAPDGNKIGTFSFAGKAESSGEGSSVAPPHFVTLTSPLSPIHDGKKHKIYVVKRSKTTNAENEAGLSSLKLFIK
jgi:hypothetical protein